MQLICKSEIPNEEVEIQQNHFLQDKENEWQCECQ